MNVKTPNEAARYRVLYGAVQAEVARRAQDLIPFFGHICEDVERSIFSLLSFQDLSSASRVTSTWQSLFKQAFKSKSDQEVEKALNSNKKHNLRDVAYALILRNEIPRAVQLLMQISSKKELYDAFNSISQLLVKQGKIGLAIQVIRTITDDTVRLPIVLSLIDSFLERGQFSEAIELLPEIGDEETLSHVVRHHLVPTLIGQGEFEIAINAALRIQHGPNENPCMDEIFTSIIAQGLSSVTNTIIDQEMIAIGLSMIKRIPRQWPTHSLHRLAIAIAKTGKFKKAKNIARKMRSEEQQLNTLRVIRELQAHRGAQ